jgi:hypothetical protein
MLFTDRTEQIPVSFDLDNDRLIARCLYDNPPTMRDAENVHEYEVIYIHK